MARLIDGLILLVVATVIGLPQVRRMAAVVTGYLDTIEQAATAGQEVSALQVYSDLVSDPRYLAAATWFTVIQMALSGIYHTSFIALRGATPGKLAVGVRVRPWAEDRRPTWGQAVLRWAATDIGSLLPGIGAVYTLLDRLWLLWDPRRQCLHDKVPRTCVVRSR